MPSGHPHDILEHKWDVPECLFTMRVTLFEQEIMLHLMQIRYFIL